MASPFMARCLYGKLNSKLNPVISNQSLAISFLCKESRELSTSTYKRGGIDAAAIAGSNMMTKMLRRQKQLIQKYEAHQKDNDKRWSTKRKNNASTSKRRILLTLALNRGLSIREHKMIIFDKHQPRKLPNCPSCA